MSAEGPEEPAAPGSVHEQVQPGARLRGGDAHAPVAGHGGESAAAPA